MNSSEVVILVVIVFFIGATVFTGGECLLPFSFNAGLNPFDNYSNTDRLNTEWSMMPFFLGAVIVLGVFFAFGPFFQASERPAPTYIADVDSSSKSVKSVSHKSAAHHTHASHQHTAHN